MIDFSRHVQMFDGDCGFCPSNAKYIAEQLTVPIEIRAWQLVDVAQFGLTDAETARRVYFVTGERRSGATSPSFRCRGCSGGSGGSSSAG